MRQNRFTTALLLTPEEGLAKDVQTALKPFGLKKLIIVKEFGELQTQTLERSFELVLIDTDAIEKSERVTIVERIRALKDNEQGLFVAFSQIESRDDLTSLKEHGFAGVIIKPVSIGIMEQALSEVIERERKQPIDREALRKVHDLFLLGHTFEAERTLSIWLEKECNSLEGLSLLALQQLKSQAFYRARATVKKVLDIKSDYLPALQLKTRISLRLGQLNEAYRCLADEEKRIARLEAKKVFEPTHRLSLEEYDELSFCDEFETREGLTALLNNLALQLSKTHQTEDALVLYRKAMGPLEDEDFHFVTLFNRGRLYLNLKRRQEAKRDLLAARAVCPHALIEKIDELLLLCDREEKRPEEESFKQIEKPKVEQLFSDLLDEKKEEKEKSVYRAFNSDEVLELVFKGEMEESTVPPESVAEWLRIKKRLMHILFLDELPSATHNEASSYEKQSEEAQ
jgi:tetratricopeptide (TPR) repeat protein